MYCTWGACAKNEKCVAERENLGECTYIRFVGYTLVNKSQVKSKATSSQP
jgi:hypothetical protein